MRKRQYMRSSGNVAKDSRDRAFSGGDTHRSEHFQFHIFDNLENRCGRLGDGLRLFRLETNQKMTS